MPYYNDLRPDVEREETGYEQVFPKMKDPERKRTIENLLRLRKGLSQEVSPRRTDDSLLVASWNIKEFGHMKKRLPESYFYIAEILSRFDLIAIQEIKTSLRDLQILLRLLGPDWSYVINDITEGNKGNSERSGYILNEKRVQFAGLAGEIVLWDDLTKGSKIKQLKRTPYMTGFEAGWKRFAIVNLHLHPGESKSNATYRGQEVNLLLKAIDKKAADNRLWSGNLILAGDFNLYDTSRVDQETIERIGQAGYREVESLKGQDTNASQTQAYDRLFIYYDPAFFTLGQTAAGKENGGVFNPFKYVFRPGQDEQVYKGYMKQHYGGTAKNLDVQADLEQYFDETWRRNQISDHFPIWFELIIDSSDEFLKKKLKKL